MQNFDHIHKAVDNKLVQGWTNRGIIISATAVGHILRDLDLLAQSKQIYASVGRIKGAGNTMADSASRLTHIPNRMFLRHFALTLPHKKSWRMPPPFNVFAYYG